jgi:hypothetical protein
MANIQDKLTPEVIRIAATTKCVCVQLRRWTTPLIPVVPAAFRQCRPTALQPLGHSNHRHFPSDPNSFSQSRCRTPSLSAGEIAQRSPSADRPAQTPSRPAYLPFRIRTRQPVKSPCCLDFLNVIFHEPIRWARKTTKHRPAVESPKFGKSEEPLDYR